MEKPQLDAIKSFLEFSKSNQFGIVLSEDFNKLRDLTNEIRSSNLKSTYEGEKEFNKRKNRYRDILPYDESRVRLESLKSDEDKTVPGSDYINANIIKSSLDGYYKYIAAQGPTRDTVADFIRMLIQYNIKIVICACNEYEGQKLKCHRYWTDQEPYCFAKNHYVTLKSKPIELDGCVIRQLKVRFVTNGVNSSSPAESNRHSKQLVSQSVSNLDPPDSIFSEYEFTQFHLVSWPDHGVPDSIESVIQILGIVRQKMVENNRLANEQLNKSNSSKSSAKKCHLPLSSDYLLVHCSAGCGRTGTIIAIDQIWNLMNENKLNSSFSLFELARSLREQRIAMIQTLSQYLFFAKSTVYLFEKHVKLSEQQKSQLQSASQLKPVTSQKQDTSAAQFKNNSMRVLDASSDNAKHDDHHHSPSLRQPDSQKSYRGLIFGSPTPKTRQNHLNTPTNSSPLSTVKHKTNRLVSNVLNIFGASNSYNANVPSPPKNAAASSPSSSSSSSSSSPSPLSISSSNSNKPRSNPLSIDENLTPNELFTSYATPTTPAKFAARSKGVPAGGKDEVMLPGTPRQGRYIYSAAKSGAKFETPDSDLVFVAKGTTSQNYQQSSSSSSSSPKMEHSRAYGRKLSMSEAERQESSSKEAETPSTSSHLANSSSELYLNDKSMYKKDAGSVCEFLSNRLRSSPPKITPPPANDDELKRSIYDIPGEIDSAVVMMMSSSSSAASSAPDNRSPNDSAALNIAPLDDSNNQSSTATVISSDLAENKSSSSLMFKNFKIIQNQFKGSPTPSAHSELRDLSQKTETEKSNSQKFRRTNFAYYDFNNNATLSPVSTQLNIADIENDLSEISEASVQATPKPQPPPLPPTASMVMMMMSSQQTPPVPPARHKARKLSANISAAQPPPLPSQPPPTHHSDPPSQPPPLPPKSMPSPGPQFRAALDRQLPQNSKYVEIRMNNPNETIMATGKGNNRNAMIFDSSPPSSAGCENSSPNSASRKINQPYYKLRPQKNDMSFTLTLPNKKYLQINNFNQLSDFEMKETPDETAAKTPNQQPLSPFPFTRTPSMSSSVASPSKDRDPKPTNPHHRNYIYYLSNFHQFGFNGLGSAPGSPSPSSSGNILKLKKSSKYESVLLGLGSGGDENSEIKMSNSNKRRSAQIFNL